LNWTSYSKVNPNFDADINDSKIRLLQGSLGNIQFEPEHDLVDSQKNSFQAQWDSRWAIFLKGGLGKVWSPKCYHTLH